MSHRVNILVEDVIWRVLEKAPRGERSRIVNVALSAWFQSRRRSDAMRRMDELRARMPAVPTRQVVRWVREDRERAE